jgi:hypothetical protein
MLGGQLRDSRPDRRQFPWAALVAPQRVTQKPIVGALARLSLDRANDCESSAPEFVWLLQLIYKAVN